MTTRTHGNQYDRNRSVTQDAASIRSQVKQAQKDGQLPADWKISVRKRRSTYSWAIDIACTSPRPIYAADPHTTDWVQHAETGKQVHAWADKYTLESQAASRFLRSLLDAHNHDGSDPLTDYVDVKFYTDVRFTTVEGVPEYAEPAPAPREAAKATAPERHALAEMQRLMSEARGDHPALAAVRREIAARMDELLAVLRAGGVDTDALLDELDTDRCGV